MKKMVMALLFLLGASVYVSSGQTQTRTIDFETQPDLSCRYTTGVCQPNTYP